jgi:hypothetical protein
MPVSRVHAPMSAAGFLISLHIKGFQTFGWSAGISPTGHEFAETRFLAVE